MSRIDQHCIFISGTDAVHGSLYSKAGYFHFGSLFDGQGSRIVENMSHSKGFLKPLLMIESLNRAKDLHESYLWYKDTALFYLVRSMEAMPFFSYKQKTNSTKHCFVMGFTHI